MGLITYGMVLGLVKIMKIICR